MLLHRYFNERREFFELAKANLGLSGIRNALRKCTPRSINDFDLPAAVAAGFSSTAHSRWTLRPKIRAVL